jgi:hypothetical protein
MFSVLFRISFFFKDMKVKQELFGKRKRACRREKGGQERGLG